MKNMIKEVAIEVIEGFEEDGVEITLKAVVNEVQDILFDTEGLDVEKSFIEQIVKELV